MFNSDNACDTTEEISEEIDEQIDFPEDALTDEDDVAHLKLNTSIIISYAPMQNGIDISHIPVQVINNMAKFVFFCLQFFSDTFCCSLRLAL